jgi:hypothetical protein
VQVVGLTTEPTASAMNGEFGTLERFDEERGRWIVRFGEGARKSLCEKNLVAFSPPPPSTPPPSNLLAAPKSPPHRKRPAPATSRFLNTILAERAPKKGKGKRGGKQGRHAEVAPKNRTQGWHAEAAPKKRKKGW